MIKSLIILLAFFIFSCSNSPNIYKTNGTVFLKNRISDIINSSIPIQDIIDDNNCNYNTSFQVREIVMHDDQ